MNQAQIRIDHLADHRDSLPEIVSWVHSEWGHLMPDVSFTQLVSIFRKRVTPHKIPETFVALLGDTLIGTASIVNNDLSTRMDLLPWLAAVYVLPGYRGMGVGSALVRAAEAEIKFLGLDRFYLITPDRSAFYVRLGWKALEKTEYRGENVTIMVYEN